MKRRVGFIALLVAVIVVVFLLQQKHAVRVEPQASEEMPAAATVEPPKERGHPTNRLGHVLVDAHDSEFANRIFPKFREFVATLEGAGVSPFGEEVSQASCSKIRVTRIPNGVLCPFVIADKWTADYLRTDTFEGIAHFGQVGPDNPFRAISRADTNALSRLAQQAVAMEHAETWKIADRVVDAVGVDRSRFETPQMIDEALFEYQLGFQTVRYRTKGTDPLNQMNYTRSFTLKATSPTSAVLVRYSNLDAR